MSARVLLHVSALLLPLIPTAVMLALTGKQFDQGGLIAATVLAGPAVLAAQTVAWLRWPALQRHARSGQSAWPTGLGMAGLTHLLFGVYLALAFVLFVGPEDWMGDGSLWQLPVQAMFFAFSSLMLAGVLSLPATAWLTHLLGRRREKELLLESR